MNANSKIYSVKTISAILVFSSIIFFPFGYFYASRSTLLTEFVETNSNQLSRSLLERSSLYSLARQKNHEKLEKLLEALIYGDIVSISQLRLLETETSLLYCKELEVLMSNASKEAQFIDDLELLLKACS